MKHLSIILAVLLLVSGTGIASAGNINDLDGDGLYEDLNGNDRLDFDDVVALFENLGALGGHPLVSICFDFNRDGRLDFGDVVALFNAV